MNAFERKKTYKEVRCEILDGHFAGSVSTMRKYPETSQSTLFGRSRFIADPLNDL